MIYGNINNLGDESAYNPLILSLLKRIKYGEWDSFKDGKYEIQGEDIFIVISSYDTMPEIEKKGEVHRKYVDIQYIFQGRELIKVANDDGNNEIHLAYKDEDDIMFYSQIKEESSLIMDIGDFAIFYPQDIHKPGCDYITKSRIRKGVIKIRLDKLKIK